MLCRGIRTGLATVGWTTRAQAQRWTSRNIRKGAWLHTHRAVWLRWRAYQPRGTADQDSTEATREAKHLPRSRAHNCGWLPSDRPGRLRHFPDRWILARHDFAQNSRSPECIYKESTSS